MTKKIQLYHGTNIKNADLIMKNGLKNRKESGNKNWAGKIISMRDYIYLTRAYPFFFAMASAKNDEYGSVLLVEVRESDLYPDEDFLRHCSENLREVKKINLALYKHYGSLSLKQLGNVAVKPSAIIRIIGRKDFKVTDMFQFSDPSVSPVSYQILGGYYRDLTDKWFKGEDYKSLTTTEYLKKL